MSTDSSALPSTGLGWGRAPARRRAATGLPTRVRRFGRLLVVLLGLYLDARVRVPRLASAHRRRVAQRWARRLLHTLRVEVRVRGHVPAADAPLLLVANHVSWLDSYALNTVSAARFVAKAEVLGWPVIGPIAAGFGTFFLKRGCYRAAARLVGGLAETLGAAQPVGGFPEGTTSQGDELLHFYPAMFEAAVLSGARVQPVAIRYRGADGAPTRAAAYVGDMSVLDSVRRLLLEPRLTAEIVFCAPLDPTGRTRRELAALARAAIAAALQLEHAVGPQTPLRRAA
jgi:1-acyl-sn-glycerol-3-phosphate acyltransferase